MTPARRPSNDESGVSGRAAASWRRGGAPALRRPDFCDDLRLGQRRELRGRRDAVLAQLEGHSQRWRRQRRASPGRWDGLRHLTASS